MNRVGLSIVLGLGLGGGLLFAIFPQLDNSLANLFYNASSRTFLLSPFGPAQYIRRTAMWIGWAFTLPAAVALIVKLIRPAKPLLISGRAVVFLLSTILMTAILLPDVVVKHHWGRPRPISTVQFNGSQEFKPWWQARTDHWNNTSFFSGEAATAFWTYAPAALAPPALRPLAFVGATIFGLTTGILRMAFGAHYASDILAAGVIAFLVVWLGHGLIYRWKILGVTDDQIDRWLTDKSIKLRSAKTFWRLAAAVGALTIVRLVALWFSIVDLFPDEARYWWWSRAPAFGYLSKPPLIAWVIAGVTHLCGNSEASVRAAAPLFYAGTSLIAFFIARQLYGERVGFWSGLSIALATGVVYSARIISTDVVLIFFWTVALLAYVKMLKTPTTACSVALGLAIGLGLLAKYAMVYFLFGIIVAGMIDPTARSLWSDRRTWLALGVAALLVTPNLVWNAAHNLVTLRKTGDNIVGAGLHLNLLGALSFLGAQFGVYGPVTFGTFLFALGRPSQARFKWADRILLGFALPPLAIVTVAAFFTGVEANWAASAGIPIIILAVAVLVRQQQWRWLYASVTIGLLLQIVLIFADPFADRLSLRFLPNPDIYHRTMGWKTISSLVRQTAAANQIQSIAAEERDAVAELRYYLRGDSWPILSWPRPDLQSNQLDFDRPWTPAAPDPVLYLAEFSPPGDRANYYSRTDALPLLFVPTSPYSARWFFPFKLSAPQQGPESLRTKSH